MATVKIKLTKCKHDNVKAQLGLLKLDTDGSLKQCVDRLKGWYRDHENDKGMEMAGCDVCGADSDAQLDACPFCGEGGVMDNGVLVQTPPPPDDFALCVACGGSGVSSKDKPCKPCKGTGKLPKPTTKPKASDKSKDKPAPESKDKPKRQGLPRGTSPADMDLAAALKLLAFQRDVGEHPETGEMIKAGIGRFGPFLLHQKKFTSIPKNDDVLTIGMNRAVTIMAEAAERKAKKEAGKGAGGKAAPSKKTKKKKTKKKKKPG